jgi:hypothetical protein
MERKPSAGLSEKDKEKTVKKAEKGEKVEGGGFKKVEAKAEKEYGSAKEGKRVAAAAMWKSLAKKKAMKEDTTEAIVYETTWVQDGKEYQTKKFVTEDEVNKFLETHVDHGVIGEDTDGSIHVCKTSDEGKVISEEVTQPKGDIMTESKNLSPEAHELVLHADNDHRLYTSSKRPIMNNLAKKAKAGNYDAEKGKKLWGYHADRAAMNYHKEHGTADHPWHKMFPKEARKQAADHWETSFRENKFEEH